MIVPVFDEEEVSTLERAGIENESADLILGGRRLSVFPLDSMVPSYGLWADFLLIEPTFHEAGPGAGACSRPVSGASAVAGPKPHVAREASNRKIVLIGFDPLFGLRESPGASQGGESNTSGPSGSPSRGLGGSMGILGAPREMPAEVKLATLRSSESLFIPKAPVTELLRPPQAL